MGIESYQFTFELVIITDLTLFSTALSMLYQTKVFLTCQMGQRGQECVSFRTHA